MSDITKFEDVIGKSLTTEIKALYEKAASKEGYEFEFMFYNYNNVLMSYEKYLTILKYIKHRSQKNKLTLEVTDTLDIAYNEAKKKDETNLDLADDSNPNVYKSYRITIEGMKQINKYMNMLHKKRNHVVMSVLASMLLEMHGKNEKNYIQGMVKTKDKENVVDINELNIRVRLAEEAAMTKNDLKHLSELTKDDILNVSFRLKQRVTLFVTDNVKIDLTITNTSRNINKIESAIPKYELEIECVKAEKEELKVMVNESLILLKLIQQSSHIITVSQTNNIITKYKQILNISDKNVTTLDARNSFSLEIQHLTELLSNRYAVTDKADGDRYALIITDNHVYLISNNLVVKDTGIDLPENLSEFNGTILDGELIFLSNMNRHIYLVFDCLFNGAKDVRKTVKLMDRLKIADNIINKCFTIGKHKGFKFSEYKTNKSEFDLNDVVNYHSQQMQQYMDALNNDIQFDKSYPLIRRKYFADVLGAKSWELYAYASVMYKKYTEDKEFNCPYNLDGLIFQPLEQEYVTSVRDSKYLDYKWKPPQKNSVDFFIQFERNKETGKIMTVYDNSVDEYVSNKPYYICNLMVGQKIKDIEQPTLFRQEEDLYLAYLFLIDGAVRDLDGNILQDKTVVEFYYNNDPNVEAKFRWVPIRTRNDKTESVIRYRRKYGNFVDIANKVWRSIINPILISDFEELAKGDTTYEKKMQNLRSKISHELIVSSAKENAYFQVKTNLAKPMRAFHNWLKDLNIITTCHPMYNNDKSNTILDIGCGRGADLMKFYFAKAQSYVGVDIDNEGLVSAVDGAESRYNQMRKTHPNYPKSVFIQADAGALLDVEHQTRALGGMSETNIRKINEYFPIDSTKKVKFDRVNCQFAMHYFLKSDDTWNNFKTNLNNNLKDSGYFMISVFDGGRIAELLKNTDVYTVNYTTQKGEKKILFEIKRYQEFKERPFKTGNTIDFHAAWLFREGQYVPEYLVDKDFIVADLEKSCGLELVDTDFFDNQYEIHKDFILNYAKYDENVETRNFLLSIAGYYDHNELNGGCFKLTRLYRFYIFRKLDSQMKKNKNIENIQKGGAITNKHVNKMDDIIEDAFIFDTKDNKNSFYESIHHVLATHKIIPKHIKLSEFMEDFGLNITDNKLSSDEINNINKKIVIEHEIENELDSKNTTSDIILDGISTIILEKDCNGMFDVDIINNSNNNKTKSIVMMKKDGKFNPVYKYQSNKKYKGLFDNNDKFITDIISNMDLL